MNTLNHYLFKLFLASYKKEALPITRSIAAILQSDVRFVKALENLTEWGEKLDEEGKNLSPTDPAVVAALSEYERVVNRVSKRVRSKSESVFLAGVGLASVTLDAVVMGDVTYDILKAGKNPFSKLASAIYDRAKVTFATDRDWETDARPTPARNTLSL